MLSKYFHPITPYKNILFKTILFVALTSLVLCIFKDLYFINNNISISYDIKVDSNDIESDYRIYYKNKSHKEMHYSSKNMLKLKKVITKNEWKTNEFNGKLEFPYVLYHFRVDLPPLGKNSTLYIKNLRINNKLITNDKLCFSPKNIASLSNLKLLPSQTPGELKLSTKENKYSIIYLKGIYNIKGFRTLNYMNLAFIILTISLSFVFLSKIFKFTTVYPKDIEKIYLLSVLGLRIFLPFSKYKTKTKQNKPIVYLTYLNSILFILFTILFALLYVYSFDFTIKEYFDSDYKNCYNKIFHNQFPVFITLYLLIFTGGVVQSKLFKTLSLIVALIFNCWILADIFTYLTFDTHFQLSYLLEYRNDFLKSNDIALNFLAKNNSISLLFVVLLLVQYHIITNNNFSNHKVNLFNKAFSLALLAVLLACYIIAPQGQISIHESKYFSIFQAQEDNLNVQYTDKYLYSKYSPRVIDIQGKNNKKNIIIVFVESLSSSQSNLFSGLNNNTPNLDKIASDYTIFLNYYSNSWNTTAANFSLLNMLPFLNGANYLNPKFNQFSFPKSLQNYGKYSTNVFFSAENTGYLDKVWKASGLENYYSGELPYYDKSQRLTFNSVPDMDLFNFTVEKTKEQLRSDRPFFNLVMTTTSHGPYRVPGTKPTEYDYEKTIQYVDTSLSKLYHELININYFENGILVITGDHRAMLPVSSQEVSKYGFRSLARVPCVIIGKGFEKQVFTENFSHAMLTNYLAYWNLPNFRTYETQNLYFPTKDKERNKYNAPKPIIFQINSPADNAIIVYNEKEFRVKYNGDRTIIEGNLPQIIKDDFLKEIYFLRTK